MGGMAIGLGVIAPRRHRHAVVHASRRGCTPQSHGMRAEGHDQPGKHGKQEQAAVTAARHA